MTDVTMLLAIAAAFAGGIGYVWACHGLVYNSDRSGNDAK